MAGSVIPALLMTGIDPICRDPSLRRSAKTFSTAERHVSPGPAGQPSHRHEQRIGLIWTATSANRLESADLPGHLEHRPAADAGHRSGWSPRRHRPGQQSLPRDLRHGCTHESHQRGSASRTDGGIRWWRNLRTVRLHPAEPLRHGRTAGRRRCFCAVRCSRTGEHSQRNESTGDHRDTARLSVQRDGHRRPHLPRAISGSPVSRHVLQKCLQIVNKTHVRKRSKS